MGLLDYYRQFEGLSEEEVNAGLREEAAERRRKALTRVETLDLSQTTWPELPRPAHRQRDHVRGAPRPAALPATCAAPSCARSSPSATASTPSRLILGNGAAELLSAATRALIEPGQKLLTRWPSYPLYPIMARRAHGRAVPVEGDVDALLAAAQDHDVRAVAIASPNDPTGELLDAGDLDRLLAGLPDGVVVLLDEALVDFSDAQPVDTSLALLERHPRLLVFRSFSKAWGLAGPRIGYVIGAPGAGELLSELEPDLGVSELSQAGALEALRNCSDILARRTATICAQRPAVTGALEAWAST